MKRIFEIPHICSGCGSCAANCNAITMVTDEIGVYRPLVDEDSCILCGKCAALCPMLQETSIDAFRLAALEETKMKYSPVAGSYINCYEGYHSSLRKTSASGGFCTFLLDQLLAEHEVDGVYCIGPKQEPGNLFEYKYVTERDELLRYSKSAYYPVNLTDTLQQIRLQEQSVAITALPCEAKAIRLAMKRDKKLARNIKYIIGIFCGGLPGKELVSYMAQKGRIVPEEITDISFREKDSVHRCNNYAMKINTGSKELVSYSHGEDFGFAYRNYLFHNTSCFCCTDVFNEYADAAFGDAWFPEYNENTLGTSVCIIRNETLDKFMKASCGDTVKEIPIERCIRAQVNVGLVAKKKRRSIVFRKIMERRYKIAAPALRRQGKRSFRDFLYYWQASARLYISSASKKKWQDVRSGKCTVDEFEAHMKRRLSILKKTRLIR